MTKRTGQCLCGAVKISADLPEKTFLACHCGQCQRWTGGGPLYAIEVENVGLDGADDIEEFFASDWGARGFCRHCGTTLYWRMRDRRITSIAVGVLDDRSDLTPTGEIFVDYRPDWLPPIHGASQSTEAQELAKLDEYLNDGTKT